jgi:hypothetical protein
LRPDDEEFMGGAARELVQVLDRGVPPAATPSDGAGRVPVLGLPAWDEVDEMALVMLRHVLRAEVYDVRLAGGADLLSGMISLVQRERPAVVFVAALAPGGLAQTRYLCRRLHSQFPTLQIVVGRWGHPRGSKKSRKLLLAAGADRVVATFRDARRQLAQLTRTPVRLQERV